ncbi:nuclease A inhibitor family protein [Pontibacter silvestris]|uniref:Nuclease A inhibitor family protein n=1 Tax=Pontibacter silvestris TaxID=2305183 RepID=A0ABW4WXK3_9BACT|nr:nuclease A inhibitor family protein [Pontibacter silvestris]MCC9137400.1 nuclease A inhibitor family protein [Pontibacter silvestris]
MNRDQLQQELVQVSSGLLVPDTKAPLEFYYHEKPQDEEFSEQLVAKWAGKPGGKKVETMEVERFFNHIFYDNTYAEDETVSEEEGEHYKKLISKMNELLQDVKVYLINELGTEVYLLGRTEDGNYAGYKTIIVDINA